jgi:ceramide glucosyltransferase
MTGAFWAGVFCLLATALHLASVAGAAMRCRARRRPLAPPADAPPVSLVRPVCGLDNHAEATLRSTFALDWPDYEILFCVARADDPVVPLVRALIEAHPERAARLLIGEDRISANPKLNNVAKGWVAARHDWVVIADSNVAMPPDAIQRLTARWTADTGAVCSPPAGSRPETFWAEVECAFLNTYQARWQFLADAAGIGFAQGKAMLLRRDVVERRGGIAALGAELAEDAATTKLVRGQGLHVRLVGNAFEQPLGARTARQVWARQARWAKLRRLTFPLFYMPEVLSGAAIPTLAAAGAAVPAGIDPALAVASLWVVWYGAELALARVAGWHLSARQPLACLVRDLLLPALWIDAWLGSDFVWRGTAMRADTAPFASAEALAPAAGIGPPVT